MAIPEVLNREDGLSLSSPIFEPRKGESAQSRGMSIEKKIDFLESLAGKVSNRRSRRWLNDRLLMELVPRLNAEEIRGLFAPPPWGDDVPLSPFCLTTVQEWDTLRNIDMDQQASLIDSFESPCEKKKGRVDADKMAVLNAWHRVDCRTREALRRSVVSELIEGYEERVRAFVTEAQDGDTLILRVQDPFRRLLLHGVCEVELCGHATLAAAHTLFKSGLINSNIIEFATLSGILTAKKVVDVKTDNSSNIQNGEAQESYFVELNFPADPSTEFNSGEVSLISTALDGASMIDIRRTTITDDLLVVLPSGKTVADLQPQYDAILKCPGSRGVIVTGIAPPESGYDFYSRFFCPKHGIDEDPVCGSAHCALASYWCKKLGKCDVVAYAASPRGGVLNIHLDEQNQRVLLRGKAVTVMEGTVLA